MSSSSVVARDPRDLCVQRNRVKLSRVLHPASTAVPLPYPVLGTSAQVFSLVSPHSLAASPTRPLDTGTVVLSDIQTYPPSASHCIPCSVFLYDCDSCALLAGTLWTTLLWLECVQSCRKTGPQVIARGWVSKCAWSPYTVNAGCPLKSFTSLARPVGPPRSEW